MEGRQHEKGDMGVPFEGNIRTMKWEWWGCGLDCLDIGNLEMEVRLEAYISRALEAGGEWTSCKLDRWQLVCSVCIVLSVGPSVVDDGPTCLMLMHMAGIGYNISTLHALILACATYVSSPMSTHHLYHLYHRINTQPWPHRQLTYSSPY